jgi:hypothetical protein
MLTSPTRTMQVRCRTMRDWMLLTSLHLLLHGHCMMAAQHGQSPGSHPPRLLKPAHQARAHLQLQALLLLLLGPLLQLVALLMAAGVGQLETPPGRRTGPWRCCC